jgi:hypothetical protein
METQNPGAEGTCVVPCGPREKFGTHGGYGGVAGNSMIFEVSIGGTRRLGHSNVDDTRGLMLTHRVAK